MKARETKYPAKLKMHIKETMENLVQFYETTRDAIQTAEWKQKLVELSTGIDRPMLISWLAQADALGFTHFDFETGKSGEVPQGWYEKPGFKAVLTAEQPHSGKLCAENSWPTNQIPSERNFANLTGGIDATPYRN